MSAPDLNPYAPPQVDDDPRRHLANADHARQASVGIDEALLRLNEHVANPALVAEDLRAAGSRVRGVTIAFCVLCGVGIALIVGSGGFERGVFAPLGLGIAVIFALLALVFLLADLSLPRRDLPSSPEATLKGFLKSFAAGRPGHAWAVLCPTARQQSVQSPVLGPIVIPAGAFSMRDPAGVKLYGQSFARPGGSQMRMMSMKRFRSGPVEGDVVTVECDATFHSYARWVTIVAAIGFMVFRPLVLVGGVLYFVTRKRHKTQLQKRLLRANNGVWYVYDANLLEADPLPRSPLED